MPPEGLPDILFPRGNEVQVASSRRPVDSSGSCFIFLWPGAIRATSPPIEVKFGPCSTLRLMFSYPHIVSKDSLRYPLKLLTLLHCTSPFAVRRLCELAPPDVLGEVLPALFQALSCKQIREVLAPLICAVDLHSATALLMQVMDPACFAEILSGAPPGKLGIILQSPPTQLQRFVAAMDRGRIPVVLLPVLREPHEVLADTLVPLLEQVETPEKLSAVANKVEEDVLVWLLRGGHPSQIAKLVDAFAAADFEPEAGALIVFLQALADERGLTRDKVLPLLHQADPLMLVPVVQRVKPGKLFEVLRRVEVGSVVRILTHTNQDFVVRLFNGPLEAAVSHIAGGFAEALKDPRTASTVRVFTNATEEFLVAADNLRDRAVQDMRDIVQRGKEERGAPAEAPDVVSDFTRGLMLQAVELGKEAYTEQQALADRIGRGFVAALQRRSSHSHDGLPEEDGSQNPLMRAMLEHLNSEPEAKAEVSAAPSASGASASGAYAAEGPVAAGASATGASASGALGLPMGPERTTPGALMPAPRQISLPIDVDIASPGGTPELSHAEPRAMGSRGPGCQLEQPALNEAVMPMSSQGKIDDGVPLWSSSAESLRSGAQEALRRSFSTADSVAKEWREVVDRGREAALASGFSCSMTKDQSRREAEETELSF